jgi:hypothetical protein
MNQVRLFFTVFLLTLAFTASAQESMIEIDIERNGASIPAYVMRHPQAVATLVLLPGGDAGSGKIINGKPASGNKEYGKPVWFVGTSRGSVSATAAAIALGNTQIDGLVLTSSVTSKKVGAISTQNIASVQTPTLIVHHKNDACQICVPEEARKIVAELAKAPTKKFILIEGGSHPEGDVCSARHWHGFINFEKETVQAITTWIKSPQN